MYSPILGFEGYPNPIIYEHFQRIIRVTWILDWLSMPEKKIRRVFYSIPSNDLDTSPTYVFFYQPLKTQGMGKKCLRQTN